MKIERLGNRNAVVITTASKAILISYKTPVAYRDLESGKYYVTDKRWSATTARHITLFLDDRKAKVISQYEIDQVLDGDPNIEVKPDGSIHGRNIEP